MKYVDSKNENENSVELIDRGFEPTDIDSIPDRMICLYCKACKEIHLWFMCDKRAVI